MTERYPTFEITIDGKPATSAFNEVGVLEIHVTDVEGTESDAAEIVVDDTDGRLETPRREAEIQIALGWSGRNADMGTYTVNDVTFDMPEDGPRKMTISCKAADEKGKTKEHRSKHYEQTTLGKIVEEAAGRAGVTPVVSSAFKSLAYSYLAQTEESDGHLLTRLAKKHGAIFKVAAGKMLFVKPGEKASDGERIFCSVVGTEVLTYRCTVKDKPIHGKVKTHYLDRKTGKREEVQWDGGQTDAPDHVIRNLYPTKEEAEKAVEARGRELGQAEKSLSLTVTGRPDIVSGAMLEVSGVRNEIDGEWEIERVEHTYTDGDGYTTKIEAKLPGEGGGKSGGSGSKSSTGKSSKGEGTKTDGGVDWTK